MANSVSHRSASFLRSLAAILACTAIVPVKSARLKSHPIIFLRRQESCSLQVLRSVNLLYLQGLSVLYLLVRGRREDSSVCLRYTSSLSL